MGATKGARAWSIALAITAAPACSAARPIPPSAVTPAPAPSAPPTPKCAFTEIPLRLHRHEGLPIRAFVEVTRDDAPARMLFDTGAYSTRLSHSLDRREIVSRAGKVTIRCKPFELDSWPIAELPKEEGLDVIGLLGADAVTGDLVELDLRAGLLRVHRHLPDEVKTWPTAPVEVVHGVMLTYAVVDGRHMRLLLDTGTDTLLLLTDTPGPGQIATTHDAGNRRLDLVWGTAKIAWETADARAVPTWRTRTHPAFEAHAKDVGGADGILGLAVLGNRRVFFDVRDGRVYVEP